MFYQYPSQSFYILIDTKKDKVHFDVDLFSSLPPTSFITGCKTKIINIFNHTLISLPLSDTKEALVWYESATNSFVPLTMAEAQDLITTFKKELPDKADSQPKSINPMVQPELSFE